MIQDDPKRLERIQWLGGIEDYLMDHSSLPLPEGWNLKTDDITTDFGYIQSVLDNRMIFEPLEKQRYIGNYELVGIAWRSRRYTAFFSGREGVYPPRSLLKVYPIPERTAQLDQRSAIQRFEREISALRKIAASEAQNPKSGIENIITAYDTFIHPDGYHYIVVTEWVDGELLSHKLQRDDNISFSERARIGAQMCRGLACAHRAGIVHRNLTPDNVIVAIDGTTKLINFDYAKFLPEQSQPLFSIGTPTRLTRILDVDYMAPEIQSTSYHNVNKESDIYSAGLILSEMFSSNPPAFGNREDKGCFGEVPLNSRALVREIVDVMCACDPADRTELPLYDIADYFDAMAELEPQR